MWSVVGCRGTSGGRKSFPEAAHMPDTPSFVHMCSCQHSPCLPGGYQTQVGRRAEKGESLFHSRIKEGINTGIYILGYLVDMRWCPWVAAKVSSVEDTEFIGSLFLFWSSRCTAHQQRRSRCRSFHIHKFQMFCSFLSMARGMAGMLERRQALRLKLQCWSHNLCFLRPNPCRRSWNKHMEHTEWISQQIKTFFSHSSTAHL